MKIKTCKECLKEYSYDENFIKKENKNYYLKYGQCSTECYHKFIHSENFKIKKYKSYLKNNGIVLDNIDDLPYIEIKKIYNKILSENVKKSQPERVKTLYEKYGSDSFVKSSKKGKITRMTDFLKKHNLFKEGMSEEEMEELFKENFNVLDNHGQKIHDGMLKKYGSEKLISLNKRNQNKLKVKEIIIEKFNVDWESLSEEEIEKYEKVIYKDFFWKNRSNHKEKILEWKKSNVKNHCEQLSVDCNQIENLTDDEINKLYSEYCSVVKNEFLIDKIGNGWKNSKKGFFEFRNGVGLFYRSSWELEFFKKINQIEYLNDFKNPKSYLYYNEEGYKKRYFPDIQFSYNDEIVICEIKPLSKVKENFIKFSTILEDENVNFKIITEDDIFIDFDDFELNLRTKLLNKNKENYEYNEKRNI